MSVKRKAASALMVLLFLQALSAFQVSHARPGVTVNLSMSTGPVGAVVTVNGTLENPGAQFKIFWQYIKDWDGRFGFLTSGYAEGYNYTANIIIPPAAKGDYYVIVEDEKNHATGYAIFTVAPEITVQPDVAPGGSTVNVYGLLINGETVNLKFYDPSTGDEIPVADAETDNVTGRLAASFRVPSKPEGDYLVRAYWNNALQAEAPLHISYQGISVRPSSAPPNAIINVCGVLALNETLIIALKNSTWSVDAAAVQTDENGQFSANVTVPRASPGSYSVAVLIASTRVEVASAPFTIMPASSVSARSDASNPYEALPGFSEITVRGENFIANESVVVYFESAPVKVAETTVASDGTFIATFTVPAGASAGVHTITAVQSQYNVSASANITIHTVTISPRLSGAPYVPGDALAFHINSTTPFEDLSEIVINVYDPNGVPFVLNGIRIDAGSIVYVNGAWAAPYDKATIKPEIPKGASEGTWFWNATFRLQLYPGIQFNVTGTFEVSRQLDITHVLQRLDQIDVKIDGVVLMQDRLYLLVQASHNYVIARLDQLESSLVGLTSSGFAEIKTKLGTFQVSLDTLNAKITDVQGDVAVISSGIGTLTAGISELQAMLASVNASIYEVRNGAAVIEAGAGKIEANLSVLNATITSIGDRVATVQTVVGTLGAKLEALDASIVAIRNGIAVLTTNLGEVHISLAALQANITRLILDSEGEILVQMETLLGPVSASLEEMGGKITAVHGNMANVVVPGLGELKVAVSSAQQSAQDASEAAIGLSTLLYAVLTLSVITAAISLFTLVHLRRREAAAS